MQTSADDGKGKLEFFKLESFMYIDKTVFKTSPIIKKYLNDEIS